MATNVRGRSGSRSRSTSGQSMWFGGQSGQGGWGSTGRSGNRGTGRKMKPPGVSGAIPSGYKSCFTGFADKIQSYKMLRSQIQGPAKFSRPSPTTLNSFANWINKGAVVQAVSASKVARWAKTTKTNFNSRTADTTACKNVLCAKFGKNAIKAVARTKSGSFMVVTTPVIKGRRFCFPK